MVKHPRRLAFVVLMIALSSTACGNLVPSTPTPTPASSAAVDAEQPLRLFFVRTYAEENAWSNRIRTGILEKLAKSGYDQAAQNLIFSEAAIGADVLKDAERLQSRVADIIAEIQAFGPHVVVVADDEAARQVIRGYPDPTLPFVFCGLNGRAWEYGLSRPNVTGVIETTYPLQTVRLGAKMMGYEPRSVLFLSDTSIASVTANDQIALALSDEEVSPVREFVGQQTDSWEAWQKLVLEDAEDFDILMLGYYGNITDENGEHMPGITVLHWTLQNSPVPVFGVQLNTIDGGGVGGLVVSGYEQGQAAAELVLQILQGAEPDSLAYRIPERNVLTVNMVAARYWDLEIPLELLVAARVERYFPVALGGQ